LCVFRCVESEERKKLKFSGYIFDYHQIIN